MRTKLFGVAYLFLSWFDSRIARAPENTFAYAQTRCFFEKEQAIQGTPDAFPESIGKHLAYLLFTKWMKIVARCMWAMARDDVVFRGGLGPLFYAPEIAVP